MPTLRPFQRADVDAIKQSNLRAILASSMGTGKTIITIAVLLETGKWSLPALVVCPASVTHNWRREFKRWAPGLRAQVIEDMSSPLDRHADVYITSWYLLDPREMEFHQLRPNTVIGDEAHFCKNEEALRSQALYRLTRRPKGLLLLTGTPIISSTDELRALEALYGARPRMIRRLLEDVAPEIPPKKRSYIYVKMRDRMRAEYSRAQEDFEDWLRKEKEKLLGEGMAEAVVERALAAEAFTKMGYLRRLVGESKVPAAADFIARAVRIGEPVVAFMEHQVVLRKLSKSLGKQRIRHRIIEGRTTPKQRQKYIDGFQDNRYPVILCTKAGKEGITLHAARNLLFVERYFTSAEEDQAEGRIWRIGQKHKTTMWYLQVPDTVDDRLDTIVRSKRIIIRQAIRDKSTEETKRGNVVALLRSWSSFAVGEKPLTPLGRGSPLPPLPRPGATYAVIFKRGRWKVKTAKRWCRMNGYYPGSTTLYEDKMRLVIHPVEVFRPKSFGLFKVCKDIKILTGKRLSARNEAIMKRREHRLQES